MKKKLIIGGIIVVIIGVLVSIFFIFTKDKKNTNKGKVPDSNETNSRETLKELPLPELTGGSRGELGIDKNINEQTIDEYLNRNDSVYRDMRLLDDPGNYESIGGDSKLSGYIKGFEIIPLPYIIPVTGLPESVGNTYQGETLFSVDSNGNYVANYEESMSIIEKYFPKDKYIFLMCGGGGYAGMMKNFLVSLGWDTNKIYNIGGYWYYDGKNNVEVKKIIDNKVTYDFDSVPYINIEFSKLHKLQNSNSNESSNEDTLVTNVKLNKSTLSLKVGETSVLNASVEPNNATDKSVIWKSSDTSVATVSSTGKITAKKKGTTTITVITNDGGKQATCKVTITPKETTNYINLDNINQDIDKFNKLRNEYNEISSKQMMFDRDSEGNHIEKYFTDGVANELWKQEYDKYEQQLKPLESQGISLLNSLVAQKKNFIILMEGPSCNTAEFPFVKSAKKILERNNINHIYLISEQAFNTIFPNSKLAYNVFSRRISSIIIVKDGKVYVHTDPDKHAFHNDNEVKDWLKKYINIK